MNAFVKSTKLLLQVYKTNTRKINRENGDGLLLYEYDNHNHKNKNKQKHLKSIEMQKELLTQLEIMFARIDRIV